MYVDALQRANYNGPLDNKEKEGTPVEALKGYEARLDGELPGKYKFLKHWDFHFGAAAQWFEFLDKLSKLILDAPRDVVMENTEKYKFKDFYEIIDFGAAGAIGPKTCEKLASDFKRNAAEVEKKMDDMFKRQYNYLAKAFTMAAEFGFVRLH